MAQGNNAWNFHLIIFIAVFIIFFFINPFWTLAVSWLLFAVISEIR